MWTCVIPIACACGCVCGYEKVRHGGASHRLKLNKSPEGKIVYESCMGGDIYK